MFHALMLQNERLLKRTVHAVLGNVSKCCEKTCWPVGLRSRDATDSDCAWVISRRETASIGGSLLQRFAVAAFGPECSERCELVPYFSLSNFLSSPSIFFQSRTSLGSMPNTFPAPRDPIRHPGIKTL